MNENINFHNKNRTYNILVIRLGVMLLHRISFLIMFYGLDEKGKLKNNFVYQYYIYMYVCI